MSVRTIFASFTYACLLIIPLLSYADEQDIVYQKIIYAEPSDYRDEYKVSIKVDTDLLITGIIYYLYKENKDVSIQLDKAHFIYQGKAQENINLQQFLKLLSKLTALDQILSDHHQDKQIYLRLNTIDDVWLDVREKVLSNNRKITQRFSKLKKTPGAWVTRPQILSKHIEKEIMDYLIHSQNIATICHTLVEMNYKCTERKVSNSTEKGIFTPELYRGGKDDTGVWLNEASAAPYYGVSPFWMSIFISIDRNKSSVEKI